MPSARAIVRPVLRSAALLICAGALSACVAADLGSKLSGEACTRSDQCMSGLQCIKGMCQAAPAGDAGALDASSYDAALPRDGAAANDARAAGDDAGK